MATRTIKITRASQVAVIWLDRQDARNALDGPMVAELEATLVRLEADDTVRALVLAGQGDSFCSGVDVRWMKRMAEASKEVNTGDAMAMGRLLQTLDRIKKPTIARVHGLSHAGALGLIAACDIAVAALDAEFCVSETRLGICAATIAPYLLRAMGERQARRYLLSGEQFSAAEAYRIGLVHELAPPDKLDTRINEILGHLLSGGPMAVPIAKEIIGQVSEDPISPKLLSDMASRTAAVRASKEGREGIKAFLEKRDPSWIGVPKGKAPQKKTRARRQASNS
jgi:methylglutaconyl-CoA hydratase